jgi:CARDB protein/cysteine-rich secretory family protein
MANAHYLVYMKLFQKNKHYKSRRNDSIRDLSLEPLEPRLLLSADPIEFQNLPFLNASAYPTDLEQLMLELINRARANPGAEADRFHINLNEGVPADEWISTAPKQPLAFNLDLIEAARGHNLWMLDTDIFDHEGVDGSDPGDRMAAAGYVFSGNWIWGENLAWAGQTGTLPNTVLFTRRLHENLFVDTDFPDRGHRTNMMESRYTEIGVGVQTGIFTADGTNYNTVITTCDFADTPGDNFLTGVVYDDKVIDDDFYTPGESISGLIVRAVRISDGHTVTTETYPSGGYSLPLPEGTYDVYINGFEVNFANYHAGQITMNDRNIKLDFPLDLIQLPDLTITSVNYTGGSFDPGSEITISVTQQNQGITGVTSKQKYRIELRLSADQVWGNVDDIILDPTLLIKSGLGAGNSKIVSQEFTIPQEIRPGAYYVAVQVDSTNVVSEDEEANNIFWSDYANVAMTGIRHFDSSRPARYLDADNDLVTVTLKGPGGGTSIQSNTGDALQIILNDTNASSSLKITTPGKEKTTVHTIIANGPLASIKAKSLDLTGNLQITGSLDSLLLDDILANARITVTVPSAKGLTVKADQVGSDVDFNLAGHLKSYLSNSFDGGSLIADSIGKVKVKSSALNVDVKALLGNITSIFAPGDITGIISAAGSVTKVVSKTGDFTGSARAGFGIGTIQAKNLLNAIVSAGGNVNKVNIKNNILDSYILAGYDVGSDGQFGLQLSGGGDVLKNGDVLSVTAKGQFARSYLAAGTLPLAPLTNVLPAVGQSANSGSILKVKFGSVETQNANQMFGLYAVNEISPFKIGKLAAVPQDFFQIVPGTG